jgi:hypothetical protein
MWGVGDGDKVRRENSVRPSVDGAFMSSCLRPYSKAEEIEKRPLHQERYRGCQTICTQTYIIPNAKDTLENPEVEGKTRF